MNSGHDAGHDTLFDGSQSCLPDSPWSSSTGSEDKDSIDDMDGDGSNAHQSSHNASNCQKILDKRVRNNQASKKFRQLRKGRQKALFDQLRDLENENHELSARMKEMISEINYLKANLPEP